MKLHVLPNTLRNTLANFHIYAGSCVQLLTGPREAVGHRLRGYLYPYMFRVVAVGDIVCSTILDYVGTPRLCIVDGKTVRVAYRDLDKALKRFGVVLRCSNPPGTISEECVEAIARALSTASSSLLLVDGEEDLLALAVLILGSDIDYVIYGVPSTGVAIIDAKGSAVTAINLFSQFEPRN